MWNRPFLIRSSPLCRADFNVTAAAVVLLTALFAVGQEQPAGTAKPTSGQAAEVSLEQRAADAAVQNLIDRVLEVSCASSRKLSTELSAAPEAERALREAVAGECGIAAVRPLENGGVEVEVTFQTRRLGEILRQLAAGNPLLNRNRLAIPASAAPAITATGKAWNDARNRSPLPGWRHSTAEQMELARRAAAADLRKSLLVQLAMLRVSDSRTVGQAFALNPDFHNQVDKRIEPALMAPATFEPSGLCHLKTTLSAKAVNDILKAAAQAATASGDPDANLEGLEAVSEAVAADGYGVAPPGELEPRVAHYPRGPQAPQWAEQTLTAKGTARLPLPDANKGVPTELAGRAARIEAMRQLWLEIERLPLPSGETVGDWLEQSPKRSEHVAAIEAAMVVATKPVPAADGSIAVTLGVRLGYVWEVVGRE